jgi:hypothetical protein
MSAVDEPQPLGAIFDTTSRGFFDLVVYDDGVLGVKGSYRGLILRGAGAGAGAAGAGVEAGTRYERKRLERVLRPATRAALARADRKLLHP